LVKPPPERERNQTEDTKKPLRNQGLFYFPELQILKVEIHSFIWIILFQRLEKDIFEILIIGSIEEYSEKLLLEKLNMNRKIAREFMLDSYIKQGALYKLKPQYFVESHVDKIKTIGTLVTLKNLPVLFQRVFLQLIIYFYQL
jgi:hypothetical protein